MNFFQILSGHLQSVTSIRWGGDGLIYSGSQDRTIKIWRDSDVRCNFFDKHNFLIPNLIYYREFFVALCKAMGTGLTH